jgi:CDP-paratose 2-epimerase
MRILITGGAGFVGSRLALAFAESEGVQVTVLDNLKRRGSELNLSNLREARIDFVHGDIRIFDDLEALNRNFDLMIEASAEPSVAAGYHDSPAYVISTNLGGTVNCLEFARKRAGRFLFLSSSRVYSIASLRGINLEERPSRFEIAPDQSQPGVTPDGIREDFCTSLARSFYGTTKLASEMLIQEYAESYGLEAIINRCGVIAGPGQFGKADQGVFTMWIAYHHFGIPLKYTGFAGTGRQVRDLLHPADLFSLMQKQIHDGRRWECQVFNVGGGRGCSVSMQEMTDACRNIIGREVPIEKIEETAPYDVPVYWSDLSKVFAYYKWAPRKTVTDIVSETALWIRSHEQILKPLLANASMQN